MIGLNQRPVLIGAFVPLIPFPPPIPDRGPALSKYGRLEAPRNSWIRQVQIVAADDNGLLVGCGQDSLLLTEIQLAGKIPNAGVRNSTITWRSYLPPASSSSSNLWLTRTIKSSPQSCGRRSYRQGFAWHSHCQRYYPSTAKSRGKRPPSLKELCFGTSALVSTD